MVVDGGHGDGYQRLQTIGSWNQQHKNIAMTMSVVQPQKTLVSFQWLPGPLFRRDFRH